MPIAPSTISAANIRSVASSEFASRVRVPQTGACANEFSDNRPDNTQSDTDFEGREKIGNGVGKAYLEQNLAPSSGERAHQIQNKRVHGEQAARRVDNDGKKGNERAMITLGSSPRPNHTMKRGASASFGKV